MKILQLTPRIPYPLNDGSAIGVYNITKYLSQAGHTVTMLSLNTKKHSQSPAVMHDICSRIETVDIDTSIRVHKAFFNLFSSMPYIVERFLSPEFEKLIRRILSEEHFDIIHIDSIFIASYIDVIKPLTQTPVVLRAHNVEYRILERLQRNMPRGIKKLYMSLLAQRLKRFEQHYCKQFDGILAITPEDFATIRAFGYQGPMVVMPAGVDLTAFAPQAHITTQQQTVFFFGGLEWAPNIEAVHWFMQRVFPSFRQQFPDIEFHIGGKNPPPDILAYQHYHKVYIHPNVPSAPNFMQSYDIMVVPLLSGGGMRLKIVEAMAMGKPIISTSLGAEGIVIRPHDNILIANTPQEFLECTALYLRDAALKQHIQNNARQTATTLYGWEQSVATALEFYTSLL